MPNGNTFCEQWYAEAIYFRFYGGFIIDSDLSYNNVIRKRSRMRKH